MFHKLKLSHAEIIHLKIDFCNKIEVFSIFDKVVVKTNA